MIVENIFMSNTFQLHLSWIFIFYMSHRILTIFLYAVLTSVINSAIYSID